MTAVKFRQKGDFKNLYSLFEKYKLDYIGKTVLNKYADVGLEALRAATPVCTGLTQASWYYTIDIEPGLARITYLNGNIQNGENIALLIQYGHQTKNGGWVVGRDYINPAIQPIFDQIIEEAIAEIK